MKKPEKLRRGDKVAIVCPASCVNEDLEIAIDILESWGLEVLEGHTLCSNHNQFAGKDSQRTQDLQQFLDHPEVTAIFAARGGYGTVRIIDRLDFTKFYKQPKWIIGFSDITVLHSHLHQQYQIQTIHGQMPISFSESSKPAMDSLYHTLFGDKPSYQYKNKSHYHRLGDCSGMLVGGNLSILHSLIASESDIDYNNKILFIEDVGERLYNLDRMLWTLKRAGKLKKLKGMIVGGFTALKDTVPGFGMTYQEIILEKVQEYDYPVAFDFPAGHIADNRTLVLGATVDLNVTKDNINLKHI